MVNGLPPHLTLVLINFLMHTIFLRKIRLVSAQANQQWIIFFVLHALTEIANTQKKKMDCSFIHFSKAFDSVWRVGLCKKLLASININGKCFQIILNMYKGIKSCVSYNGEQSSFFSSSRGVRQGENLSPVFICLIFERLRIFPMGQKLQWC